jgi:hypothetical protein
MNILTNNNVNAFTSTFYFFATHKAKQKTTKEPPSHRTKTQKHGQTATRQKRKGEGITTLPTINWGLSD